MAQSKPLLVSGDIVKELECIVCMEQVQLRLMSCGHRCCQICIGNLSEGGELNCPYCRRLVRIPDEGFPVCRLTEYLKEQLALNQSGDNTSTVIPKKSKGKSQQCSKKDCTREVDLLCQNCSQYLCYRCGKRTVCSLRDDKHDMVDLSEVVIAAENKLQQWRRRTKDEIESIKVSIRQSQRMIDDRLSMIKVSEMIETEPDEMEKITLIEQICKTPVRPPISHLLSMRLELVSSHDTVYQSNSVAHHGDDILVGTNGGLKVFSRVSKHIRLEETGKNIEVAQHDGDIFIAHMQEGLVKVLQYSNTATDQLFSFPRETKFVNFLSANALYLSVINFDKRQLEIYNRKTGILTGVKLSADTDKLYNSCFVSDGGLLVVSHTTKHQLTKYTIDNKSDKASITKQWSVDADEFVHAVGESENGLIFLCGTKSKKIHVYDSAGTKLKEMKVAELPELYHDISIKGNELAVAGWDTKKLLLFKIMY